MPMPFCYYVKMELNKTSGVKYMRKEANLEQWRKLYEVAVRLKEMKPWEELWDMDLITILTSDEEEPCVCSIMGKGGKCLGIGSYLGFKAISDFLLMVDSNKMPPHQLIRYQNNLTCFVGDREELTSKERGIIKDLGLKFRGNNNWIYFRAFEPGYIPYMPDEKQVLKLTEILQHLFMAIKAMHNGIKVDFVGGNTLLRRFDKERKLWINYEAPVIMPKVKCPAPVLNDELLMKRLSNQESTKAKLELDIAYLNSSVNDKKYDKPVLPRLCILADIKTGILLDQTMVELEDEDIDIVLNTLFNYILQRGKPKTIYIRDIYIHSILFDVCKKLEIDLKINQNLKNIDRFLIEFGRRNF